MAKQIINEGDTGLEARTKINENFTETYGGLLYRPITEPAVVASALVLDCSDKEEALFEPTPTPITNNFTLSLANSSNASLVSMVLQITGTIQITMPSDVNVSIPSSIGDWSGKPALEIAAGTANIIEFQFLRYKTTPKWLLKVSEVAI